VIVKTGGKDRDYSDTVHRYFGNRYGMLGRVLQIIFNLLINTGAGFIIFLIINQNLYPNLAFMLKSFGVNIDPSDITPSFSRFSIIYCGIIVSAIVFPMIIKKEIGLLIKLNSYGIYFVSVLIGFVIYTGIASMVNTKFDFEYKENTNNPDEPRHLYLFGENPSMMAGTLTLGFFSHSFVLSMFKNNANQENNKRDLFFGYCLVSFTYVSVGVLGYIGFSGINFQPEFKDVNHYLKLIRIGSSSSTRKIFSSFS
jgi:hypothetical protein